MNTVTVLLGCLLVFAVVTSIVQSKAIVELETHALSDAPQGVNENTGLDLIADKLVDGLHQLMARDAQDIEVGKTMDFGKIINQAKRLAEVIQIVKARDIGAGIELIKKIIMEFLNQGNQ